MTLSLFYQELIQQSKQLSNNHSTIPVPSKGDYQNQLKQYKHQIFNSTMMEMETVIKQASTAKRIANHQERHSGLIFKWITGKENDIADTPLRTKSSLPNTPEQASSQYPERSYLTSSR
mmetsp:Transcript_4081/g.6239  ORF Transcript_4081/g.6239 Transcript_4081/m.6239 type:complete len:119 (-) Transcript_4081:684-1040(-)